MSESKRVPKIDWGIEFLKFRLGRMTQLQLALALGITRRAVIYIESGERQPRVKTVEKFKALRKKHESARNPGN